MEKYIITKEEKAQYIKDFPVLECENSIGIDYDGYISVKCKKLTTTYTTEQAVKMIIKTVVF